MTGKTVLWTLAMSLAFCVAVAYMVEARWVPGPGSLLIDSWTATMYSTSMTGRDFFLDTALRTGEIMLGALLVVWAATAMTRRTGR